MDPARRPGGRHLSADARDEAKATVVSCLYPLEGLGLSSCSSVTLTKTRQSFRGVGTRALVVSIPWSLESLVFHAVRSHNAIQLIPEDAGLFSASREYPTT